MYIKFQSPTESDNGWYVRTLAADEQFLHPDGKLYETVEYFVSEQAAMDTLLAFIRNSLTPKA